VHGAVRPQLRYRPLRRGGIRRPDRDLPRVSRATAARPVTFQAARGIDAADGPRLACEVIEPTLEGTDLEDADWVLVNRAGDVIASDETDCGP
jgi:hypothetical protein